SGPFVWGYGNQGSFGTLQGVNGQGSLTANGGTEISGYGGLRDGFRFINPQGQTVRWGTGTAGTLQVSNQSAFENFGTLRLERAGRMASGPDGSAFRNFGSVDVASGGSFEM